jgi:hypothetical protein
MITICLFEAHSRRATLTKEVQLERTCVGILEQCVGSWFDLFREQ